eukprot:GHVR01093538.1.p1 GENE.GHVR01093538.1~~GHVR01093538.1.p1  ORF type:complete len:113 (+),score=19.43 GHVR01093538.1:336-674(+)
MGIGGFSDIVWCQNDQHTVIVVKHISFWLLSLILIVIPLILLFDCTVHILDKHKQKKYKSHGQTYDARSPIQDRPQQRHPHRRRQTQRARNHQHRRPPQAVNTRKNWLMRPE